MKQTHHLATLNAQPEAMPSLPHAYSLLSLSLSHSLSDSLTGSSVLSLTSMLFIKFSVVSYTMFLPGILE